MVGAWNWITMKLIAFECLSVSYRGMRQLLPAAETLALAAGDTGGAVFEPHQTDIQKTKIMASSPIISGQIDCETVETVADFILGDSKITTNGDCSHEIKTCLLLGRKVMINLVSILKSRDTTLPTKVHLVKAMVFPVVMYGCHSWTIKKDEH